MTETPKSYETIRGVPTDLLARNFVTSLLRTRGNVNEWDLLAKMLIRGLRGEPEPVETNSRCEG